MKLQTSESHHIYHFTDANSDGVYDVGEMVAASFVYTLDDAGNRVASAENVDGESYQYTWQYDGLNRLVEEQLDASDNAVDYTDTFVYDLTGNRTSRTHDAGSEGSEQRALTRPAVFGCGPCLQKNYLS